VLDWVTAAGVLLLVPQLRMAQRQRHRQFEDLYIQRYWTINDQSGDLTLTGSDVKQRNAVAYFRLSEDQMEMRRAGWITDDTWRLWVDGIARAMRSDELARHFRDVIGADPEAFTWLQAHEARAFDSTFDPCKLPWLVKWTRGISGLLTAGFGTHSGGPPACALGSSFAA